MFIAIGTQWRVAYGGRTGLDYTALKATMDIWDVPVKERPDLFEDLRVMEDEALNLMAELAEKAKRNGHG